MQKAAAEPPGPNVRDNQKGLPVLATAESKHCSPIVSDQPSEPAEPRTILVMGQSKVQKNYTTDPRSLPRVNENRYFNRSEHPPQTGS